MSPPRKEDRIHHERVGGEGDTTLGNVEHRTVVEARKMRIREARKDDTLEKAARGSSAATVVEENAPRLRHG